MTDNITVSRELLRQIVDVWDSPLGAHDMFVVTGKLKALLDAEPAPAVRTVQEPVAWGVDWGSHGDRSCVSIIKKHANGVHEVVATEYGPVGSAQPRKAVKLSDSEVFGMWAGTANTVPHCKHHKHFARAIEQAVWAKLGCTE